LSFLITRPGGPGYPVIFGAQLYFGTVAIFGAGEGRSVSGAGSKKAGRSEFREAKNRSKIMKNKGKCPCCCALSVPSLLVSFLLVALPFYDNRTEREAKKLHSPARGMKKVHIPDAPARAVGKT
jgi:hypothetical protein